MRCNWIVAACLGSSLLNTGWAEVQDHKQLVFSDGESSLNAGAPQQAARPLNIAIIGAGAAGASTAYHLSRFSRELGIPIHIDVFERNPYIGGRSTTVIPHGHLNNPIELGASIFVEVNSILVNATRDLHLPVSGLASASTRRSAQQPSLGIWDGTQFRVTLGGGRWSSWWDVPKLLWRYGLAPSRTVALMKKTVGRFLRMYDEPVFPFSDLTQAALDVGLLDVTAATGEDFLRQNGITGDFGREVVQASTRVNYAQNLAYIHALEAMVCMATDGAMAVDGGNWQIFERMIIAADAHVHLESQVSHVIKQHNDSYLLTSRDTVDPSLQNSQLFDAVILATPLQFANITLRSEQEDSAFQQNLPQPIPYVQLHVTLFTSRNALSPAAFSLPSSALVPAAVLTTLPDDEIPHPGNLSVGSPDFFSISQVGCASPPDDRGAPCPETVYKIFSATPPRPEDLCALFDKRSTPCHDDDDDDDTPLECLHACGISWLHRKTWHSYPYETPRVTFDAIRLDAPSSTHEHSASAPPPGRPAPRGAGLWYTAAMDSFISTMETNALMGRNVARLLLDAYVQSAS